MKFGPEFGYYLQSLKSWLIVKEKNLQTAGSIFSNRKVNMAKDEKRHVRATIG